MSIYGGVRINHADSEQRPQAAPKKFSLADRVKKVQSTQKAHRKVAGDLLKEQDLAKSALASDESWAKVKGQLAVALRDARAALAGYGLDDYPDSVVEVELRLGKFLARTSGLRFDYGLGPPPHTHAHATAAAPAAQWLRLPPLGQGPTRCRRRPAMSRTSSSQPGLQIAISAG